MGFSCGAGAWAGGTSRHWDGTKTPLQQFSSYPSFYGSDADHCIPGFRYLQACYFRGTLLGAVRSVNRRRYFELFLRCQRFGFNPAFDARFLTCSLHHFEEFFQALTSTKQVPITTGQAALLPQFLSHLSFSGCYGDRHTTRYSFPQASYFTRTLSGAVRLLNRRRYFALFLGCQRFQRKACLDTRGLRCSCHHFKEFFQHLTSVETRPYENTFAAILITSIFLRLLFGPLSNAFWRSAS